MPIICAINTIKLHLKKWYLRPVILAAVLPVIHRLETFLMNNTLTAEAAIQKSSSFFLESYYVNLFLTF